MKMKLNCINNFNKRKKNTNYKKTTQFNSTHYTPMGLEFGF